MILVAFVAGGIDALAGRGRLIDIAASLAALETNKLQHKISIRSAVPAFPR